MCMYVWAGLGQSQSDVYDETWALDMKSMEWFQVNTSHSVDIPEARFDAAGGVYGNMLWLSMGRNKDKRTLSDTWILTVNVSDDGEIIGNLGHVLLYS